MRPRRTFDFLRDQAERFDLPVCVAGRIAAAAPPAPGAHDRGRWRVYPTASCIELVDAWSGALLDAGIDRGDRVALIGWNAPAWLFLDLAVQQVGGVSVPVHPRLAPEDWRLILERTRARLCFVTDPPLRGRVLAMREELEDLEAVHELGAVVDGGSSWNARVRARPSPAPDGLARRRAEVSSDDVATIIYTSGTTGCPKGVVLSHRNLVSSVRAITRAVPLPPRRRALSALPLAHGFERLVVLGYMASGISIYCLDAIEDLGAELPTVRPHYMAAVPRLLEKQYEGLLKRRGGLRGIRRLLFDRALGFGLAYDESRGRSPWTRAQRSLARRVLFEPWRASLGGRLELVWCGGARLEPPLARLFAAAGMPVIEGYGLTETSTFVTANGPQAAERRVGTVGRPVPGVEVRVGSDGEILVRGPNVMRGYLDRPDLTAAAIDAEGWLHTGDVGALDPDDFLRITGRKKDLFKLAGGEYVAPEPLEAHYRQSRLIEHVVIVGENRRHIAALVVPSLPELVDRCRACGLPHGSRPELLRRPAIHALIRDELARLGQGLARADRIERFELVPDEWSIESGELSPSLKVKRHVVARRYADAIDRCYREGAERGGERS